MNQELELMRAHAKAAEWSEMALFAHENMNNHALTFDVWCRAVGETIKAYTALVEYRERELREAEMAYTYATMAEVYA